ncbi:dna mismatch repair protein : DNA mismatch repair protein MutL OS=Planctomyces limnophilus (strain ATCC 43296 / DSM 3776 / IFAM 1008 / 290) GN=mutL PE=3 SV=1: HATPase_c_3: DNA_mis_repair: MutL_C [Gemmata massiliana]|uniref:DNA mismatch repair protein MutL n=1 Tax=Gemmata massiliana TaxID=1210884 RepID=A0A6P2CQ95_9BACT|nr:DNA mismatch repair endonuclease MutL [Gemmata massiliana]VTR91198.1 dna mismatch repair protein : DNA mismatch repair protein MutL OS=Planctomyces limnophilus (strain ATCC 43296 / DSM 3776 / IFAM 1008 / 290) GN=mutL PE=3 SV=1: HATPase_c_3: DNA_mis_repair: MutL_C [Gemmata massiliana]
MPRIRQLPPEVVTKIAAGEVIERPASVVKELLENSIDAGATRIDIDLDAGGTELIRVVDDGCGIEPDDLALAFSQHATSKLETADDLFRIGTMGFRGEALASIAGVGQITLQSRTREAASGCEVKCDGGALSDPRPWNGSSGTRLEVRHLFYNVPVRKKFLKSVATELGHVCETVTRLSLAHPHLHITLRHNNRLVYDIPASAGLTDRIALFFTGEVRDALYEIDSGEGPMRLTGYIADPKCDRGNSKLQYLFVNGRWFRDRSVAHALQESFRGLLMSGRYAIGFLFLTIPPDKVDVNVHPTKSEVRFQENSLIYSLVRSTIKHRLLKENLVPHLTVPQGEEIGGPEPSPVEAPSLFTSPRRELAEQTLAPWEMGEIADPFWRTPAGVIPKSTPATSFTKRDSGDRWSGGFSTPPQRSEPVERTIPEPVLRSPFVAAPPAPAREVARGPVVREEAFSAKEPQAPIPVSKPFLEQRAAPSAPQETEEWADDTAESSTSEPTPEGSENTDAEPAHVESQFERAAIEPSAEELPAAPQPAPSAPAAEEKISVPSAGTAIQLHDSYLVLETPDGMLVIDQHALHERILFEQLRRRIRSGQLEIQRLLIPEPIDLPAEQAALVLESAEALAELGLEVSDFGGSTILLSSYPTLLGRKAPHTILRGVIDHIVTQERAPTKEALLHLLMATMACKAAVKAGDKLSSEEINYLLHLRAMAEDSHHCPHGRPTSLLFSRQELDKQFRRT